MLMLNHYHQDKKQGKKMKVFRHFESDRILFMFYSTQYQLLEIMLTIVIFLGDFYRPNIK